MKLIKPHGITGFKSMLRMSPLTMSISAIIFGLTFLINENNIETMKYIISVLASISIVIHLVELYIMGSRLFNQVKTNMFTIAVLLKLIMSSILSFNNIYFAMYMFNQKSFKISDTDFKKGETYYYPKMYFAFFYFSVYTFFTQGYGDVYPDNLLSRSVAVTQMGLSYLITAYIFSKILVYSEDRKNKKK